MAELGRREEESVAGGGEELERSQVSKMSSNVSCYQRSPGWRATLTMTNTYTTRAGERLDSVPEVADMTGELPKGNCTEDRIGASRAIAVSQEASGGESVVDGDKSKLPPSTRPVVLVVGWR